MAALAQLNNGDMRVGDRPFLVIVAGNLAWAAAGLIPPTAIIYRKRHVESWIYNRAVL